MARNSTVAAGASAEVSWFRIRNALAAALPSSGYQGLILSNPFLVGYFDSVDEMNRVYDRYAGHTALEAGSDGWRLVRAKE